MTVHPLLGPNANIFCSECRSSRSNPHDRMGSVNFCQANQAQDRLALLDFAHDHPELYNDRGVKQGHELIELFNAQHPGWKISEDLFRSDGNENESLLTNGNQGYFNLKGLHAVEVCHHRSTCPESGCQQRLSITSKVIDMALFPPDSQIQKVAKQIVKVAKQIIAGVYKLLSSLNAFYNASIRLVYACGLSCAQSLVVFAALARAQNYGARLGLSIDSRYFYGINGFVDHQVNDVRHWTAFSYADMRVVVATSVLLGLAVVAQSLINRKITILSREESS